MTAKCIREKIHWSIPIALWYNSRKWILTNTRKKRPKSTKLNLLCLGDRIYEITTGTDFILVSNGRHFRVNKFQYYWWENGWHDNRNKWHIHCCVLTVTCVFLYITAGGIFLIMDVHTKPIHCLYKLSVLQSVSPHNIYSLYLHTTFTVCISTQYLQSLSPHNIYSLYLHTLFTVSISTQYLQSVSPHNIYSLYLHTILTVCISTQYLRSLSPHNI